MTILVATDGSESARAAARVACELGQASGDPILFVAVWRELRGDFGIPLQLIFRELLEIERDHAASVLAQAKEDAESAGVPAEAVSRHGDPVREICAIARERNARMIVLGSHGWGTIEGALFGSVASGVLHAAPCPVLVVPEPQSAQPDPLSAAGAGRRAGDDDA